MILTILFLVLTYQVDLTIANQHLCPVTVELWGCGQVKWRTINIPPGGHKRIIGSRNWTTFKIVVKGECVENRTYQAKKNVIRGSVGYVSTRGRITLKP